MGASDSEETGSLPLTAPGSAWASTHLCQGPEQEQGLSHSLLGLTQKQVHSGRKE